MTPVSRQPPSSAAAYYGKGGLRERLGRAWRERGAIRFLGWLIARLRCRLIHYEGAWVYFMDLRAEDQGTVADASGVVGDPALRYGHPDEDALAAIEWPSEFDMSEARCGKFVRQRRAGHEVVVQFDGERPIGYCFLEKGNYRILHRRLFKDDPNMISICDGFIAPSQRRCGRLVMLLRHCIDWGRANGFARMFTGMMTWNVASKRGVERVGFRQVGRTQILHVFGRPHEWKDARLRTFERRTLLGGDLSGGEVP